MIPNRAIAVGSRGASLRTVRYSISARSYCSAWKSRLALARYRFIRACLEQPAPEMATRHTISIPKLEKQNAFALHSGGGKMFRLHHGVRKLRPKKNPPILINWDENISM